MKITHITLLQNENGADIAFFHTDIQSGCYPYKEMATLRLDIAAGGGKKYLAKHFPDIKVEVIGIPPSN